MTASTPGRPVAIVDIGSNSVRLVAYEGLSRAPTPIFNEKVLCGLGRGVAATGLIGTDAMERALGALRSFRVLCRNLGIEDVSVLATAAARDARNGPAFLAAAGLALGAEVQLIDGPREAELSALGVCSGVRRADGVVGDMGGGSPKRAGKIARDALVGASPIRGLDGRTFFAVGGTWRALAKLHMRACGYPLGVMHGYSIPAAEASELGLLAERVEGGDAAALASVAAARRPLLAYGAAVLEEVIRLGCPREVVISAMGVREGLLFERLDPRTRGEDPLLAAAREINARHARHPGHGPDLCAWTDRFAAAAGPPEAPEDARLRHAACLMADIAWRAHPDHRGEHALNAIANGTFSGVDHAGRAFLALAVACRHGGGEGEAGAGLRALLTPQRLDRARLLGAVLRVAFLLSAAMGDVLPRIALRCSKARLTLVLPPDLADLASDRCVGRLKQLAKLVGREAAVG